MRNRFRRLFGLLTTLALLAGLAVPVSAGTMSVEANQFVTVFVELSGASLAEAGQVNEAAHLQKIGNEHANFRRAANAAKVTLNERFSYSHVFNGFSVEVKVSDLPKLSRMAGVKAVYPVVEIERPETTLAEELEPYMATALDQTRASEAQAAGYTGKGITVAIIDTGIDYSHPDLGGCFGKGCRVVGGWDFVGDDGYGSIHWIANPDPDPMDIQGHGTHVAGIVGANGAVKGVAPDVTFRAYKVFDQGSSQADIIIAALEMAMRDKVDVVNMSLGAAFQWPQYPTATASEALVKKGIVVIASAGNSGREGLFSGGAPALGESVIAVASFQNSHTVVSKGLLGDGTAFGYGLMTFSPEAVGLPATEIVALPASNHGCTAADWAGVDVAGKIAMVSRGTCPFADKSVNAQAMGAVAAIVHNNVPGYFAGTLGAAGNYIPTVSISLEDANVIRAKLPTTATFTAESHQSLDPVGGLVSDFSSWGLSPDLSLKPDVGAPGGNIYSTYPLASGGYATLSGTSMSAPHVAGVAALLLQAQPSLNPGDMQAVLQGTAKPVVYDRSLPFLLSAHRQGGGMVDVMSALNRAVIASPTKLSLGEMAPGATVTKTISLRGQANKPVTYTVGHETGLITGPMNSATANTFSLYAGGAEVSVGGKVTVQGRSSRSISVSITAPAGLPERSIFGGWITFTPDDASMPALRVPYGGMVGDYQTVNILNRNGHGFPWLSELVGTSYQNRNATGMTLDLSQEDAAAYLLVNFAHQSQQVIMEAVSVNGQSYGSFFEAEYVGRHASPVSNASNLSFFSAYAWDGMDSNGNPVPNGDYNLVIRVLKPLGDATNPAHWETWTSNTVTVVGNE